MLLAIDSGNTNIVFALFDGDQLLGEWRSATNQDRTADDYGIWLVQLIRMHGFEPAAIDAAIIATVVPSNTFALKSMCRRYFDCEALVVGEPGLEIGIRIDVDHPEEVGADRIVNAVAAHTLFEDKSLIVVDFGTATTFDLIGVDGVYRGGAIAPGINQSLEALHQAAAQLPRVAIGRPKSVVGRSTVPAMRSGVFWGYVGLIEGLVKRIKDEMEDQKMWVVATGGLAPLFMEVSHAIDQLMPDLTLRGLLCIHRLNEDRYKKKHL